MTTNKRIFLNIIATYGRSLFALACGLFSGRWALMSLGEVDYGLFGVVGGLTAFIAFFNNVLAFSIARFYATSIGAAAKMSEIGAVEEGIEECRKWFSIALIIHTIVPSLLMVFGYPVGEWTVRNYLTIPVDKVNTCIWVFRFVCVSCFLGMVSVPFNAMYQAKQYIAELTVYSVVTTALNVCFLYYMVTHPAIWLARYAAWTCFLSIAPQLIITFRAVKLFPECRFRIRYWKAWKDLKGLFAYTGWQMFGAVGGLLKGQGIQVLVNKYYGPAVNASMSIANTVNGQTQTLASSLTGAFQPAISTAYGAGDANRVKSLSYRACKFGMLLAIIFVLPLSLELPEVMRIWLVRPPRYVVEFCWFMMAMALVDRTTIGHMMALNSGTRIAAYQLTLGGALIMTLPMAWVFAHYGFGPLSVGWAMLITSVICAWGRVLFARSLIGLSVRYWLFRIMIPMFAICVVGSLAGCCSRYFLQESFLRVIVTTIITEVVIFSLSWLVAFDDEERHYVMDRLKRIVH